MQGNLHNSSHGMAPFPSSGSGAMIQRFSTANAIAAPSQ
jgi:hypothetical protein